MPCPPEENREKDDRRGEMLPGELSPQEIAAECELIQSTWTAAEKLIRSGGLDYATALAAEDDRIRSERRKARQNDRPRIVAERRRRLWRAIVRAARAMGGKYAAALRDDWEPPGLSENR